MGNNDKQVNPYDYMSFWGFMAKMITHSEGTVFGFFLLSLALILVPCFVTWRVSVAKYDSAAEVRRIELLAEHPEVRQELRDERQAALTIVQEILDSTDDGIISSQNRATLIEIVRSLTAEIK